LLPQIHCFDGSPKVTLCNGGLGFLPNFFKVSLSFLNLKRNTFYFPPPKTLVLFSDVNSTMRKSTSTYLLWQGKLRNYARECIFFCEHAIPQPPFFFLECTIRHQGLYPHILPMFDGSSTWWSPIFRINARNPRIAFRFFPADVFGQRSFHSRTLA